MNRPAQLSTLLLVVFCQTNAAFADEQNISPVQNQSSSVESFFQIDSTTPNDSNKSFAGNDKCKTKQKKSSDKLFFKVLDNIGIPMPLKTSEDIDPSLAPKASSSRKQNESKQPALNLERIKAPDESSSTEASKECPNKIPKSELEGTMYDSAATSNDKKQAR
ncbi:MAG: hypothetical protein K2X81_29425 [Candidatus Obscuribacterales bacterium]|nr:hypothetical protein [Candidatus Obscuribacterales bacterium]